MNINGKWYTEPQIEAYVTELENKVAELEAKHWNECGQIAHYSDENAKLKEAKGIIRVCNRVLGYLLECEIESTSTRHEVETLLKNITVFLSGGGENE